MTRIELEEQYKQKFGSYPMFLASGYGTEAQETEQIKTSIRTGKPLEELPEAEENVLQ